MLALASTRAAKVIKKALRPRRAFSASAETPSFSVYEYPTRTEAPEISVTKAKDITPDQIERSTPGKLRLPSDPFDDRSELTPEQRKKLKSETKNSLDSLKLNSLPITRAVPPFIPPNVPSTELEAPETCITTLENGVRVVSQVSRYTWSTTPKQIPCPCF